MRNINWEIYEQRKHRLFPFLRHGIQYLSLSPMKMYYHVSIKKNKCLPRDGEASTSKPVDTTIFSHHVENQKRDKRLIYYSTIQTFRTISKVSNYHHTFVRFNHRILALFPLHRRKYYSNLHAVLYKNLSTFVRMLYFIDALPTSAQTSILNFVVIYNTME